MAGKIIEATLRLATDFAKAIADLRELKRARDEAARPSGKSAGTSAAGDAAQATNATQQAAAGQRRADSELTASHQAELKARTAADRQAATEAAAARRAALDAQKEAERKARREARDAEEQERRAQRRTDAQAERDKLQATAASVRAEREARRKLGQVAPQVTDIVTGLAGGQNPLMVALQQGGQLRDIFGGAGNAARALLQVFTPMRVAVVGVVGAAAALATQIVSGYNESERLRRTLALTGNAAGTSLGQIGNFAEGIAKEIGTSVAFARDVVEGLLTVSGQTATTMNDTGRAAAALGRLTGKSAAEILKSFEDQSAGVTDWAVKSNKAYNFLTATQVAYIRSLESQGRVQEAIAFTNKELADTLLPRIAASLGSLQRAWEFVTKQMSDFLDMLKSIGRDETSENALKKLEERLRTLRLLAQAPQTPVSRRAIADEINRNEAAQSGVRTGLVEDEREARQARKAQREIFEQSKEFQTAKTNLELAQEGLRTEAVLAGIERRRQAVELADAQGLLSERAKAEALNSLDQERLTAQINLQQERVNQAKKLARTEKGELEAEAAKARVAEAQAQLVTLESQLATSVADAQRIVGADVLAKSREEAQAWADVWLRADQQVRDLTKQADLTAADQLPDPAERAAAKARASIVELRKQLDDSARDLQLRIAVALDPNSRDALRQQLADLLLQGTQVVNEETRRATQDSLSKQLGDQLEALQILEQGLAQQVEQGAITTEQAERRKFAAREAALPQLRQTLQLLQNLATTDAERNVVAGLLLKLGELQDKTTELERTLKGSIGSGFATLFTDIATGAERLDRAVGKFLANIARAVLDLAARRLGEQLVNSLFNSQKSGFGDAAVSFLARMFAGTFHTGGVVDGGARMGRMVAPWIFAGAQVLHGGGIAGLAANEQPAILQKGEEVLTADNPRHINNFRGGGPLIGSLNVSVSTDGTGTAAGDAATAQGLSRGIKAVVEQYIVEQLRPGGLLDTTLRNR